MEKKCFKCGETKPLTEFYKHAQMADGHLNKCIVCAKNDSQKRFIEKINDPEFIESERTRGREKYHRYKYKSVTSQKTRERWENRFPEKTKASRDAQNIKVPDGFQKHHWSYCKEHRKDIVPLSVKDHKKAHRFLIYDQERMMYRTTDGILLDTKENHTEYISGKIKNEAD